MSKSNFIEVFHQLEPSKATDFLALSDPCLFSLELTTLSTSWLVNPATLWLRETVSVCSTFLLFCDFFHFFLPIMGHSKDVLIISFSSAIDFFRLILIHFESDLVRGRWALAGVMEFMTESSSAIGADRKRSRRSRSQAILPLKRELASERERARIWPCPFPAWCKRTVSKVCRQFLERNYRNFFT